MHREKKNGKSERSPDSRSKTVFEGGPIMKDVIVEMFLALAAVNVTTKQFSCYPY